MAFRLFFWYENKNYCGGNVKREVSMGLRFENYKKKKIVTWLSFLRIKRESFWFFLDLRL
jgi:hypothetical protein